MYWICYLFNVHYNVFYWIEQTRDNPFQWISLHVFEFTMFHEWKYLSFKFKQKICPTEVFISSLQSHLLSISFNSMYLLKDNPSLLISLCLMCWSMLYSIFSTIIMQSCMDLFLNRLRCISRIKTTHFLTYESEVNGWNEISHTTGYDQTDTVYSIQFQSYPTNPIITSDKELSNYLYFNIIIMQCYSTDLCVSITLLLNERILCVLIQAIRLNIVVVYVGNR